MFGARIVSVPLADGVPERFPRGRWPTPGSINAPGALHADLWCFDLNPTTDVASLVACLNPDEQARAARFIREEHRRRFAAFRGLLRHILGAYLGLEPQNVPIAASERGKPYLALKLSTPLEFSVSHSEDRALYAITGAPSAGIDCECIPHHRKFDLDGLVNRVMNEEERAYLNSAIVESDAAARAEAFLQLWTLKEATLKAIGAGLDRGLDAVSALGAVTGADGDTWCDAQGRRLRRWSFAAEEACVAALAVELPDKKRPRA